MRRLLIGLALALLAGAMPATAAAGLELGVQDDAFLSSAEPNAWPLARELRPDVIRYNVDWASVARKRPAQAQLPGDPAYDWAATDRIVRNSAAQGARVLLTLVQAPAWANGGRAPRWAPLDARDFGRFCRSVATRYSGSYVPAGAAKALPRVDAYTVWNEPNRGQFLQPQGAHGWEAPKVMARLMGPCQGAIHAVSPDARRRARPAREPRRPGRHRADRVPHALPRGGRSPARRRRAQSLPGQPAAGLPRRRAGGRRRDHGAQPRPPRAVPRGRLRRARPDLADGVRVAHREPAGHRPDHAGAPGRAGRAVGRAHPRALPVRRDARLVPDPRRLADELLAQRPRHARQREETGLRASGSGLRAATTGRRYRPRSCSLSGSSSRSS